MLRADDVWDAGGLGCGELVLDLRGRLMAMPGRTLRLIAQDPGAPEDIPSWCRMTGHQLLQYDAPSNSYWIKARGEATGTSTAADEVEQIYTPKVFELAKSLGPPSRLEAPDATAHARSKLCGSAIEIDLGLTGETVSGYAQRVNACLLGRTSAAVVAQQIIGATRDELADVSLAMRHMLAGTGAPPTGRWADLAVLEPVRLLSARHASALLVFTALDRALASRPASD